MKKETTQQEYSIEERIKQLEAANPGCKVEKRMGTTVNLKDLADNESVVWGDGKTYHFLISQIKATTPEKEEAPKMIEVWYGAEDTWLEPYIGWKFQFLQIKGDKVQFKMNDDGFHWANKKCFKEFEDDAKPNPIEKEEAETVERAAKKYSETNSLFEASDTAFIAGAKWQASQPTTQSKGRKFTANEVAQLMVIHIGQPELFTERGAFSREKFDNYITQSKQ